ncbi:MAG TPA: TRAP transporter substrate-binding protein DctP [Desulfobacterales bacterium]|nr:TRAP transporter substrate-binding protein DctP [Desulfobacterales bacterium]
MKYCEIIRIFLLSGLILCSTRVSAVEIKIATLSPDGQVWMEKMREGAEEILEKTHQRIRFKFYPGGVMGDDGAVLRKIRIGQLQGGVFVAGSLAHIFPDSQVYGLPLKFNTFEEVDYVRKRMDPVLMDGLEKNGFVSFGLAEGGFAFIMSKAPIRTIDDLRRQKVWIPDNDRMSLVVLTAFDIAPIPLTLADVRAGLQTGLIDTVTTPPIGALALQWHTQIKYLTETPIVYIYGFLSVDKKTFSNISPEDQKILREVMGRVFREIDRRNRQDNVKALEALRNQGIQFVKPSPDALNEWHTKVSEIYKQLVEMDRVSRHIIDVLDKNLADYHSQHAEADK